MQRFFLILLPKIHACLAMGITLCSTNVILITDSMAAAANTAACDAVLVPVASLLLDVLLVLTQYAVIVHQLDVTAHSQSCSKLLLL
jgi:hypothetical protein